MAGEGEGGVGGEAGFYMSFVRLQKIWTQPEYANYCVCMCVCAYVLWGVSTAVVVSVKGGLKIMVLGSTHFSHHNISSEKIKKPCLP